MPYTIDVHLRDTTTGYAAMYHDDFDWEGFEKRLEDIPGDIHFQWTEGNFGCDCNRYDFLQRALGSVEESWDDCPCGHTRVAIDLMVRHETGEVLMRDNGWVTDADR